MSRSPALAAYLAASRVLTPAVRLWLSARARRGKEDPARLPERMGAAGAERPAGPLVWLHAASVGESLAALPLIEALSVIRRDLRFLLTTGTVTSARMMRDRLPERALHQFAPVDLRGPVLRFLDHWRPDLCVWIESELWPRLICETRSRGAPMALINARMSERSAAGWARAPGLVRELLGGFDVICAQDEAAAARFADLGAPADRVRLTGTLKAGAAPPDVAQPREAVTAALAGRPVWLAASTHKGEEMAAARATRLAAERAPKLALIVAPRHPERGPEVARAIAAAGLRAALRSAGELPGPETDVYVADTLGEMGAWLRVAPVAFVGGSLSRDGGHNPYEPALLGSAIVHGPHVENFRPQYVALAAAGGAREVVDADGLAEAVGLLLTDETVRRRQADAAREALSGDEKALAATLDALSPLLPAPA